MVVNIQHFLKFFISSLKPLNLIMQILTFSSFFIVKSLKFNYFLFGINVVILVSAMSGNISFDLRVFHMFRSFEPI